MEARITFKNGETLTVEKNGDSYIMQNKPVFPADLSLVTVESEDGSREYHDAILIECASVDGRYWFAFNEESQEEKERKMLQTRLDEAEAALIELAGLIGGMD